MQQIKRSLGLLTLTAFVTALLLQAVPPRSAHAAQITTRSLTLVQGTVDSDSDGINDGGSLPGGTVSHRFRFDLPTGGGGNEVGSIKFEYCTTAASVPGGIQCDAPTGLSTAGITFGGHGAGNDVVFTSVASTAANVAYVSRTPAAAITAGDTVDVTIDGVVNPSATNTTFFVRISSHTATNATGAAIDTGTVAASTANKITLSGTMPESLVFCTGATISIIGVVPDCTSATAGNIAFDRLFSPTETATAWSQMAASTNATGGYAITVNGPTLTSGSNTIAPMVNTLGGAPIPGAFGNSQFGLNLVLNTIEDVNNDPLGLGVNPASNTTNYKGQPATDYGTADNFKYFSSDVVAASDNGGVGGADSQLYTVSYMVNVPGSQPAGTYTTTLTYICTPTF